MIPTVIPASWDLWSDHGDRRGTDLGITPRVFSFFAIFFSLSPGFLFQAKFLLSTTLQLLEDIGCCGPMRGTSRGRSCRKQSHLLVPGTAGLSPSAGLPHGICCPKRAACIPAGAAATHGLCTKRRPGNRHPALCENAGCCPSFSLPLIAQQLWNAFLTDVYN